MYTHSEHKFLISPTLSLSGDGTSGPLSHTTRVWHTPDEACADFSTNTSGRFAQRRNFTAGAPEWRRFRLSIGEGAQKKIVQKGSVRVDRKWYNKNGKNGLISHDGNRNSAMVQFLLQTGLR